MSTALRVVRSASLVVLGMATCGAAVGFAVGGPLYALVSVIALVFRIAPAGDCLVRITVALAMTVLFVPFQWVSGRCLAAWIAETDDQPR